MTMWPTEDQVKAELQHRVIKYVLERGHVLDARTLVVIEAIVDAIVCKKPDAIWRNAETP